MEMVGRSEPLCSQIGPICLHNGSDGPTIPINSPTALSTAKSALSAYTMAQIDLPFPLTHLLPSQQPNRPYLPTQWLRLTYHSHLLTYCPLNSQIGPTYLPTYLPTANSQQPTANSQQ